MWISSPAGQKPFQFRTSLLTQLPKPLSMDGYLTLNFLLLAITTDRGQQFESSLYVETSHASWILIGYILQHTTPLPMDYIYIYNYSRMFPPTVKRSCEVSTRLNPLGQQPSNDPHIGICNALSKTVTAQPLN